MRSIFLGAKIIQKVYSRETVDFLAANAQLNPVPTSKEHILANPDIYADTEYIFATWGMPEFTKEEIAKYLPSLKAVFYGAGTVQYFARDFLNSGVRIFSAWGANAVPVAEYTVAQITLANKGFFLAGKRYNSLENGKKAASYFSKMPGNFDVNVGIIGAGMIGKMVIKMLQSYRVNVLVYDPFLSEEQAEALGAKKVPLEELFASCQTISNHVANLPATVGMLHYGLFRLMKENAVFINTGRGAQVVEADLIRILKENPNMTAVLDVTQPEPPLEDSEFYTLENVILTPHIAGSSGKEVARMGEYMADQFRKHISNEPCEYEVTIEMLDTMA